MATRPKLLYLVSEDWYFVSHRLALARAAKSAGYDVAVVTRTSAHADEIRDNGLRLIPMAFERAGLGPAFEIRSLKQIFQVYCRERPEIAHHVAMKPVIYGSIAARAAGTRCVVNALMGLGYIFSSDTARAKLLRPGVRYALRQSLRGHATKVIVQNKDDADQLIRDCKVPIENVNLIRGSGVDVAKFVCGPPPSGVPVVVFPARYLIDKGLNEFVAAAEILKRSGVVARFAIVGAIDPLNPSSLTASQVAGFVGSGIIEDWGWRTDMPAVFATSALVCLPSYREGLPKSLLEAAASGRAIVATDVPGCREIVRPEINGWLVSPKDPVALAAALKEAISHPQLCVNYGVAGRHIVEREFSLNSVIDATLAVYRDGLSEPDSRQTPHAYPRP